jgi:cyclopropane fatty-acyl-phospholipid synthase-like methyltransferase
MSSQSFENYARVAQIQHVGNTEVAGRYGFQAAAERRIIGDVAAKLALDSEDTLLEIGCGPGNLLIPLSFMTARTSGIDNAAALERLAARCGTPARIQSHPGDFLTMDLPATKFTKILVYSVLQYVDSESTALTFVGRALALLGPGGRLLLGDLPNRDKKRRFAASAAGEQSSREWSAQVTTAAMHPLSALPTDEHLVDVGDELVLSLLRFARQSGYESYLLSQPPGLPFGHTREDLLFVAPR